MYVKLNEVARHGVAGPPAPGQPRLFTAGVLTVCEHVSLFLVNVIIPILVAVICDLNIEKVR